MKKSRKSNQIKKLKKEIKKIFGWRQNIVEYKSKKINDKIKIFHSYNSSKQAIEMIEFLIVSMVVIARMEQIK